MNARPLAMQISAIAALRGRSEIGATEPFELIFVAHT
jgi:hypothetical protein